MGLDWKDIAGTIGKTAPILGTLIGGPYGAAVGGLVASILRTGSSADEVSQALAENPDAAVKLRQIESDNQVKLHDLVLTHAAAMYATEAAALANVNDTMQAEAKGEHWPTYSWRPFNGFIVGIMAFGCYFVLPLMQIPVPSVPESVWLMFGGILGVASWFRGKSQVSRLDIEHNPKG